jgi:hypothetical protein
VLARHLAIPPSAVSLVIDQLDFALLVFGKGTPSPPSWVCGG